MLNKPECVLDFRYFKVATFCVPRGAEPLLAALPSLCGSSQTVSVRFRSVIVEARSSDAALHHPPSRSDSPYTASWWVWGHCPVEKQQL